MEKAAGGEIIPGFASHLSEPQLVGYRIPLGSIPSRAFPSCMDLSHNSSHWQDLQNGRLLMRRLGLVHELDCLAGKPGPPVQFRE